MSDQAIETSVIDQSSSPADSFAPNNDAIKSESTKELESWDRAYAQATNQISTSDSEQAPELGDSTQVTEESPSDGIENPATSPEGDATNAPQVSTAEAPQHWPDDKKEQFNALPDDAKPLVLSFQKEMQGAFTRGMQTIRERESELGEITSLAEQFRQGPEAAREVIQRLAQDARIDVFFEPPPPEDQIPEFEDAQAMAKWAAEKALRDLEARNRVTETQRDRELQDARVKQNFKEEIQQTAAKYADFVDHKEGIMSVLTANSSLSVEQAYQIAAFEPMRRMAIEGDAAKRELAALKKTVEKQKAQSTRTGNGISGLPEASSSNDPWDRAYDEAIQRVANQNR